MSAVDKILALSRSSARPDGDVSAACLSASLEAAASRTGHLPDGKRQGYWMQVKGLLSDGQSHMAEQLVRWIAYDIDRSLVDPEVPWAIAPELGCAMPRVHCAALLPEEIMTRVSHREFNLPSKDELLAVLGECGSPELVRDHLPSASRGRLSSSTLHRHHLMVVSGKAADNLEGPLATRLCWRPRLALTPPGTGA